MNACARMALTVLGVILLISAFADAAPKRSEIHVYLLLGQSNMAGRGKVEAQDKVVHPRVFMLTRDGKWVPATEPVQYDRGANTGVGPALAFGKALAEHDKSVRIALHQGENDSLNPEQAAAYEKNLHAMIAEMREDLGAPDVPFVAAEMGAFFVNRMTNAPTVNDALKRLPTRVKHTACVSAQGLSHKGDRLHFSAEAARELGLRYARAIVTLRKRDKKTKP